MAETIWKPSNETRSNLTLTPFLTSTLAATVSPLLECDHQPYDWFSYTIRVLLMVPVLIFGIFGNAMNIIIFRQKRMRACMVNWYLVALAATDVGVLLSSFCMLSLPVICEDLSSLTLFNLGVSAQRWTYALGLIMQTASVGMTVLVSAHRFLGVVFPFRAQQFCTAQRVKGAMWSVAAFAVGFNLPRWFEIDVDACQSSDYNATATSLTLSALRSNNLYYSAYMVILYTVVMFALPFLLLIIMNALIVRTVHRSYRLRQMLTNKVSTTALGNSASAPTAGPKIVERRKRSPKHQTVASPQQQQQQYERAACDSGVGSGSSSSTSNVKENKTTIMLIAVVFMFLLCNSLAFINNILEVLTIHGVPVRQTYLFSVELSNFLVVINSATNVFIYWTFSARYRQLFRRYIYYFCCCFTPLATAVCTRGFQRRRQGATPNNARTPNGGGGGAILAEPSAPNRLLTIRKNNRCDEASPCLDFPGPASVRLRGEGFGKNPAGTASICGRGSKLEPKDSRRPTRFKHIQQLDSQPREALLPENEASSESQRKRASIVSSV